MVIQSVNRTRGFTMVELLIALALSGMVIAAVGALYISVLKDQARRTQQLVVMQGVDDVLSYIRRDALRAGYSTSGNQLMVPGASGVLISTSSSLGYRYYNGEKYTAVEFKLDDNQIKLCRKSADTSSGLSACASYEHLTDQKTIRVSQFQVSVLPAVSAAYVTITLSASLKNGEHPYQQTVSFLQRN